MSVCLGPATAVLSLQRTSRIGYRTDASKLTRKCPKVTHQSSFAVFSHVSGGQANSTIALRLVPTLVEVGPPKRIFAKW